MIKAIIFDSDGTLFYSNKLGIKTLEKVCEKFGKKLDVKKYDELNGLTRKDKISNLFKDDFKEMWPLWDELYRTQYSKYVTAYDSTIKTVKKLSKNYKLFIFSTKYSYLVKTALDKFEISDLFCSIIGGESKPSKPDIKNITKEIKKNNISLDEILLVGDTFVDQESAKNLGCKFIYLQQENVKKEKVKSYYKKIRDLKELIPIIDELNSN